MYIVRAYSLITLTAIAGEEFINIQICLCAKYIIFGKFCKSSTQTGDNSIRILLNCLLLRCRKIYTFLTASLMELNLTGCWNNAEIMVNFQNLPHNYRHNSCRRKKLVFSINQKYLWKYFWCRFYSSPSASLCCVEIILTSAFPDPIKQENFIIYMAEFQKKLISVPLMTEMRAILHS